MNFIKQRWVDIVIFSLTVLATIFFSGKQGVIGPGTQRILVFVIICTVFVLLGKTASGQKSSESGFLKNQMHRNWRYIIPVFLGLLIGYLYVNLK